MKIGVIGAGNIGGTLGKKWAAAAGHSVMYGVRDPQSAKTRALLDAAAGKAKVDNIASAIAFSEVIVIAIPGTTVETLAREHAAALNGKVVIDTTNRFGTSEISNVRTIAAHAPRAMIYRAFNSYGWECFAEPRFEGIQSDLIYCGPDGVARQTIEQLITEIGLRPVRVGDLDQVQVVDSVGVLWFALIRSQGKGRHLALKVLMD